MSGKPAVLFVCLGNICRSPLAEAAFRHELAEAGLDIAVDSAGTSDWHIGEPPDPRAISTALRYGIDIRSYRGRQVAPADFDRFTHIVALDDENLMALEARQPRGSIAELSLLLDYVEGREGESVADPYFGGVAGFEQTWADVTAAARGLIKRLRSAS